MASLALSGILPGMLLGGNRDHRLFDKSVGLNKNCEAQVKEAPVKEANHELGIIDESGDEDECDDDDYDDDDVNIKQVNSGVALSDIDPDTRRTSVLSEYEFVNNNQNNNTNKYKKRVSFDSNENVPLLHMGPAHAFHMAVQDIKEHEDPTIDMSGGTILKQEIHKDNSDA